MHLIPVVPPLPFLALLLSAVAAVAHAAAAKPRDAILLSNVESLTLRGDKQTAHRRVAAIPQLTCISHRDICAKYAIDVMRCENKGSGYDTEDIQWSCTAQLPPELKLGSTDVICEGYSSPDDPYILKGSCGVEYRLVLTRAGEDKWPDLGGGSSSGLPFVDRVFPILFWVIFVAVLGYIVVSACRAAPDGPAHPRAARRNNHGGGGGGGDDGWDDPPPPYPGTGGGRGGGSRKNNNSNKTRGTGGLGGGGSAGANWQSNLMSGAAGAAAGYYAGSRGRNNNNSNNTSNAAPNYGSSWGGAGSSRSGSSGSSSGSAAASTSRHESTGFGSTSRR